MTGQPGHTAQTGQTSQKEQTGQAYLTFKLDFPGNLLLAAFATSLFFLLLHVLVPCGKEKTFLDSNL